VTFLPIATRELLVASRRPLTFRVRLFTAVAAAVLTFLLLVFGNSGAAVLGSTLFHWLTRAAFLFAAISGIFLAADCISEEKREGTLGLLFLTDLGGFDVVAGKLLIVGLNALLALGAFLPVLSFAWILGGVSVGEFWRIALVLLNSLIFSLAVGIFVSSRHQSQKHALAETALWLAFTFLGLAVLDVALARWRPGTTLRGWCGISPWIGFKAASDDLYRKNPVHFWASVRLTHLASWIAIAAASWIVKRRWQIVPTEVDPQPVIQVHIGPDARSVTVHRRSVGLRAELLDKNPVYALVASETRVTVWIWWLTALAILVMAINTVRQGTPTMPLVYNIVGTFGQTGARVDAFSVALTGIMAAVKTLFAWQACEFFVTCRRRNAFEALLTTPLTDQEILSGLWAALRRNFLAPLIVLPLAMTVGPTFQSILHASTSAVGYSAGDVAVWGSWLYTLITLPLELLAIAWMGAWLALSEQRPNWAFAKTVFLVVALPLLLFCVPSLLIAGAVFSYARGRFMHLPIRAILNGVTSRDQLQTDTRPYWKRELWQT
jgi:ABC-type transport system involved in multi-copper enzyme maturation permease subunit